MGVCYFYLSHLQQVGSEDPTFYRDVDVVVGCFMAGENRCSRGVTVAVLGMVGGK